MEPIKVLQVFGTMNRAGAETFIMNVYRNIDRSKVQFDFLVYKKEKGDYDDEIERLGGKVYRLAPLHPKTFFKYSKSLNRFFQENNGYNVVHSHLDTLSTFPLAASKKVGIPVRIAHSHTSNVPKNIKALFRSSSKLFINKYCTHRFGCSRKAMDWLFGAGKGTLDTSRIINNGVKTDDFIFNKLVREELRNNLNLNGKFVIGSVGKFTPTKNHTFLIDVFLKLLKREPNSVLVFIGTGGLESQIKDKVSRLGLNEKVMFLGSRDDVNKVMQAFDVLVQPSLYEGFPVTLVESQAAGLPCVVSKAITEEVKITELVEFRGLDESLSNWSKAILQTKNIERKDTKSSIIKAGFDIETVAQLLEKFYIDSYNKKLIYIKT